MDCKTSTAIEFRYKLGYSQHNLILTKEQSVLMRIMKIFAKEEMILQHSVLDYRNNLYFVEYKLATEVDEKGHMDRNEDKENKREKQIKEHLKYYFIRINPDEEKFDADIYIGKIYNRINEVNKKLIEEETKSSSIEKITKKVIRNSTRV